MLEWIRKQGKDSLVMAHMLRVGLGPGLLPRTRALVTTSRQDQINSSMIPRGLQALRSKSVLHQVCAMLL
jgi:hypothetical protein